VRISFQGVLGWFIMVVRSGYLNFKFLKKCHFGDKLRKINWVIKIIWQLFDIIFKMYDQIIKGA
jgi:hypothetical protein